MMQLFTAIIHLWVQGIDPPFLGLVPEPTANGEWDLS